ncbi:bifunctional 2',3'-cyclic-nucleotide 2'-phosphodiesterase/3'-nucleotidase [Celeribacter sp.]|uniref:bifunctional 2',3'-cyclic-nucleotide 2'-phosphodiesterase/3'-nucleotidase n=1 Tax=Celeribacter sp. TaxID=1890673 RepID=UPI003A8D1906
MIDLHPFSTCSRENAVHLRIMETTDLHVHVFPYDYYADRPVDTAGLARTATHIATARAQAANSILVDNGDFLQGNPMGDYLAFEHGFREGDEHPVISAMNLLGYDASTLGNHEFNYGLGFLLKSLAAAAFPVVSANVVKHRGAEPLKDQTLLKPYVLLDRKVIDGKGKSHDLRIGIIGFVPPQIMTWDQAHLDGNVVTRDIVDTARAYIPEMKERGADIIVALNHSGIGCEKAVAGMENAAIPLAAIDGIDAIATGHSHLVFPSPQFASYKAVDVDKGTIHGKPAVMAGFWGSHLGVIDLLLDHDGEGWRVTASETTTRPIATRNEVGAVSPQVESDPYVIEKVQMHHDRTLAYIRRAAGSTDRALHSFFCHVTTDYSLRIVAQAQAWRIKARLADTEYADLPILSAAAPLKAGGRSGPDHYTNVAKGPLTLRNIADLYLFPNALRAVRITGAQLRDWLEMSASMFNRIEIGSHNTLLLNPDFPTYAFEVIHGVDYEIDLSQPARFDALRHVTDAQHRRISKLSYNGSPVRDDQNFVVATNSYRASGGGGFPGADGTTTILECAESNRDVLYDYIRTHDQIRFDTTSGWRFRSLENTSVLFDTSPQARAHLDELSAYRVSDLGDTPQGFARFRLEIG